MRERDERLMDRLIQKNLDGREGTAMRSRIDRADTTHSPRRAPQEGSRTQNAWTLKLQPTTQLLSSKLEVLWKGRFQFHNAVPDTRGHPGIRA